MKFKRRQILLGGVAAGVAATIGTEYNTRRSQQARIARLLSLADRSQANQTRLLKQTFDADAKKIQAGLQVQAAVPISRPLIPYDRNLSELLIQCSKLATQQYLTGKTIPAYDGSIKTLPAYFSELDEYTQLTSFQGREAQVENTVEVEVPTTAQSDAQDPLEQQASDVQDTIGQSVKEAVKLKQLTPVYLGFVLVSKQRNIIVFRGTQRNVEWLNNLYARQKTYTDPASGLVFGKVHQGFVDNYKSIIKPIPREIAEKLDPSIPCYITGHSLGSALAVLTSMDLAYNFPKLKPRIQLYTYAGARVGDPTFARLHAEYVPNHYRIVNLADVVPLLPPLQSPGGTYVHTGEEWSFLTQQGDFLPNHVVDTYREAIVRQVETNKKRAFPVAGIG